MRALRVLVVLAAGVVVLASLTVGRPEVFGLVMPASLVLFVAGLGLAASDAIPLRRLPLGADVLAVAASAVAAARADRWLAVILGLAVTVAHLAAWRYRAETAATTRVSTEDPPPTSSATPSATAAASEPRATHGSSPSP